MSAVECSPLQSTGELATTSTSPGLGCSAEKWSYSGPTMLGICAPCASPVPANSQLEGSVMTMFARTGLHCHISPSRALSGRLFGGSLHAQGVTSALSIPYNGSALAFL